MTAFRYASFCLVVSVCLLACEAGPAPYEEIDDGFSGESAGEMRFILRNGSEREVFLYSECGPRWFLLSNVDGSSFGDSVDDECACECGEVCQLEVYCDSLEKCDVEAERLAPGELLEREWSGRFQRWSEDGEGEACYVHRYFTDQPLLARFCFAENAEDASAPIDDCVERQFDYEPGGTLEHVISD